jgi:hypothetical protein
MHIYYHYSLFLQVMKIYDPWQPIKEGVTYGSLFVSQWTVSDTQYLQQQKQGTQNVPLWRVHANISAVEEQYSLFAILRMRLKPKRTVASVTSKTTIIHSVSITRSHFAHHTSTRTQMERVHKRVKSENTSTDVYQGVEVHLQIFLNLALRLVTFTR